MTSAVATSVASQSIPVLEVFIKSSTTRTAAFRLVDVYILQQCVHVVVLELYIHIYVYIPKFHQKQSLETLNLKMCL